MTIAPITMVQLIDKKRQGQAHTEGEIQALVDMSMSGEAADYQISAWLMAACIHGLDLDETTWLTRAFAESGQTLDLSSVDGIVVDKHSTGGVGDKTTLVLIPLLASCGVKVAKLSGRGLGFTGGTIDKLEAIPGFRTSLSTKEFISQLNSIGVAISGQTSDLAPADAKFYALRDVTATIDSIPLIAASVVSKKIAAGAQVIVLDIKVGRGAFMKTMEDARRLAETCREVGKRLGKSISTVISSMDQPLGYAIGHTVEIMETIETLKGRGPADLKALCITLGAVALVGAGIYPNQSKAAEALIIKLVEGHAYEKFKQLVKAQGGDLDALEDYSLMPQPDRISLFPAPQSGHIEGVDSLKIAQAAKLLGAGRSTKESSINLGVGVVLHKKVGQRVEEGERLVELYVSGKHHHEALDMVKDAISITKKEVPPPQLIDEICLGAVLPAPASA